VAVTKHKIGDLLASVEGADMVLGWIDDIDQSRNPFCYKICWMDSINEDFVYTTDHVETYKLLLKELCKKSTK
jgi:hypothetical protein